MTEPKQVFYKVGDREIALKKLTDGQMAAAVKISERARKAVELEDKKEPKDRDYSPSLDAAAKLLRIVDSMIVSDDDREFLEDQMIEGRVDLPDLMNILNAFSDQEEEAPKTGPKARARRGS